MSDEVWRSVVGYEGWYEVSNEGNVRSVPRVARNGRRFPGLPLAAQAHRDGHLRVPLYRNSEEKFFFVHRLVLAAFVGECPPGMQGCHNDGDSTNNRLSNLRWDTVSANARDRVRHGRDAEARKTHCINGHPLSGKNLYPPCPSNSYRRCISCGRARSFARSKHVPYTKELADEFFERLVS